MLPGNSFKTLQCLENYSDYILDYPDETTLNQSILELTFEPNNSSTETKDCNEELAKLTDMEFWFLFE